MWRHLPLAGPILLLLLWGGASGTTASAVGVRRGAPTPPPERSRAPPACRICRLAERLGLAMTALTVPGYPRCPGPVHALYAILPRGRVDAAEMAHLHVALNEDVLDVLPDFEARPYLEIRDAAARIARIPFPPGPLLTDTTVTLGPDVLRSLAGLRGRLRWGRHDVPDPDAMASFWLDPPSPRETGRRADLRLALAGETTWTLHVLEAQLLLDQGFAQAALREALAALALQPREPHAAAIALGAYETLGLRMLPEARRLGAGLVYALLQERGHQTRRCHLDDPSHGIAPYRGPRSRGCGFGARRRDAARKPALTPGAAAPPGSPGADP